MWFIVAGLGVLALFLIYKILSDRDEITEKQERINLYSTEIDNLKHEQSELRKSLNKTTFRNLFLEASLNKTNSEYQKLQAKCTELDKHNRNLNTIVTEKDNTITTLRSRSKAYKTYISKLSSNLSVEYRFKSAGAKKISARIHYTPDQFKRLQSATQQDIKVLKYLENKKKWEIKGTTDTYETDLNTCTCNDSKTRHTICKHMYALAIYLSDKKLHEHLNNIEKIDGEDF